MIEHDALTRIDKALTDGKLASTVSLNDFEKPIIKQLHLLTSKPMMYVLNKKAGSKNLDEIKR